jgi:hypothetical protein
LLTVKHIARQLGATEGAEILEAALVLPIVFTLLLGIVAFGRAFNIYSTIQQAAQQGAITAARATCATCTNNFPLDVTVDSAISAVMQASSLDPTQIPNNSNPPSPLSCVNPPPALAPCTTSAHKITICREVLLNSTPIGTPPPPAQCGVVVSFQYPFTFVLPFTSINNSQIILSAQAQSRMEN